MIISYEITLSDETKIEAITDKNGFFSMKIDNASILIEGGDITVIQDNKAEFSIESISVLEKTTNESEKSWNNEIIRHCIICGSRYYCITGGCARTPCGWICG